MPFADRLRELREAGGVSRQELADSSGLSRGAVRDYEQGRRTPSLECAILLADALGVSLEEFRDVPPSPAKAEKPVSRKKGK